MSSFEEQLAALDISLFARIPAQLEDGDRRSLLAVQLAIRERFPEYIYLEIGSHLGGSIQPHLRDSRCKRIYSIDKRPIEQVDDRGFPCYYPENSTKRMLELLREIDPQVDARITCFDMDASAVDPRAVDPRPDLCFIDGEHTDRAAFSDYASCRKMMGNRGIVLFHDANIVFPALVRILGELRDSGTPFHGYILPSSVFVLELGGAEIHSHPSIAAMLIDNHEQYLFGLLSLEHYREVYNREPIRVLRKIWQTFLRIKHDIRQTWLRVTTSRGSRIK
jgi:hypothetical protein